MDAPVVVKPVTISKSIELMLQNYQKITDDFVLDNINTTIWAKKGQVVDEKVLEHLKNQIYNV